MLAKAIMPFDFQGLITATRGEILDIENPMLFLDLLQAGFVEQVDRTSEE